MEGFCRGGMSCCRLRVLVFHALFWGFISLRVFGAALLGEDRTSAAVAPCWQLEEFTVIQECDRCSDFHLKSQSACRLTGYVERVNCSTTHRDDYRSCHSPLLDERLFWRFEAAMLGLTALFSVLVVLRQRALDRLASDKVRRQIQSI